jgi:hypothetical protein
MSGQLSSWHSQHRCRNRRRSRRHSSDSSKRVVVTAAATQAMMARLMCLTVSS